jgi:hypothetical protein
VLDEQGFNGCFGGRESARRGSSRICENHRRKILVLTHLKLKLNFILNLKFKLNFKLDFNFSSKFNSEASAPKLQPRS